MKYGCEWRGWCSNSGSVWIQLKTHASGVLAFFFLIQHLLHCSCPMNSAFSPMNSNFLIIFVIVFSFQQNKRYPNRPSVSGSYGVILFKYIRWGWCTLLSYL